MKNYFSHQVFVLFLSSFVALSSLAFDASALPLQNKRFVKKDGLYQGTREEKPLSEKDKQTYEKAKELEAVFISAMIEPMFPEGRESGLYGGGQANNVYRMMMIQEYGKLMAPTSGLGIAEKITDDLH